MQSAERYCSPDSNKFPESLGIENTYLCLWILRISNRVNSENNFDLTELNRPCDWEILLLGVWPRELKIHPFRNWHVNGPRGIIHNRHRVKTTHTLIHWWEFTNKAWSTDQYITGCHSVSEGITLSPGVWGQPERKWRSQLKRWSLSISPFCIFTGTTATSLTRLPVVIFLSLARQTHVITVTHRQAFYLLVT